MATTVEVHEGLHEGLNKGLHERVHEKTEIILPSPNGNSNSVGAVSWGAIFAGAAGAAALSLILLILGTGLGFSSISPWASEGVSAKTFGISGILWVTLTSLAASGMGGYLAGRLRPRWTATTYDEVYFRDTAHGFLAWAVASLITAGLLASTIGVVVSGGIKAGASAVNGAVTSAAVVGKNSDSFGLDGDATGYFIDSLFRKPASTSTANLSSTSFPSTPATATSTDNDVTNGSETNSVAADTGTSNSIPSAEVGRIFINAFRSESLSESDAKYLGQIVAIHTELGEQEAEQRVKDIYNQWQQNLQQLEASAKEAADDARKATAYISLWFFIALLIGAFTASWLATFGGRQRDL